MSRNKKIRLFVQKSGALRLLSPGVISWISKSGTAPDDRSIYFLGETLISTKEWRKRVAGLPERIKEDRGMGFPEIDFLKSAPIATVIVSLYKSDAYLDSFLESLLSQTALSKCEVLIVSVQPTNEVRTLLANKLGKIRQITIMESAELIGIYEAWNLAISCTEGKYITNMNADDLRAPNSLEIQIQTIEKTGADVVYQDVFYAYEHGLTFDEVASVNVRSNLPEGSLKLLAQGINFPHNAPMWKRTLHEQVGFFDTTFKSAGDHDFWIRCSLAEAVFIKCDSIHVSYFINPNGMSTKKNSPGALEGQRILEKYRRYA
jgi:glycosyltransferase involved in cell wall biosynthesis